MLLLILFSLSLKGNNKKQIYLYLKNNYLIFDAELKPLFNDQRVNEIIDNGLANIILTRASLVRASDNKKIYLYIRQCTVRFDIWESIYIVKYEDNNLVTTLTYKSKEEMYKLCLNFKNFKIIPLQQLKKGNYYVDLILELNPISPQLLSNVKKWLQRMPERHRQLTSSQNFFGSMVSIFLNPKIGRADKQIEVKSNSIETK